MPLVNGPRAPSSASALPRRHPYSTDRATGPASSASRRYSGPRRRGRDGGVSGRGDAWLGEGETMPVVKEPPSYSRLAPAVGAGVHLCVPFSARGRGRWLAPLVTTDPPWSDVRRLHAPSDLYVLERRLASQIVERGTCCWQVCCSIAITSNAPRRKASGAAQAACCEDHLAF